MQHKEDWITAAWTWDLQSFSQTGNLSHSEEIISYFSHSCTHQSKPQLTVPLLISHCLSSLRLLPGIPKL